MKNLGSYNQQINEAYGAFESQHQTIKFEKQTCASISDIDPINQLRKELNREELLKTVMNFDISDEIKAFVDDYERIYGERDVFLWKFLGTVFKDAGVTLSTVDKKYTESLIECKILLSILYTIIDDVADINRDEVLLKQIIDALNNQSNCKSNEKIIFAKKIWDYILEEISNYPRYEEFKNIFLYDFKQVLNSTEYSCLLNNNPDMINPNEMEIYDCHGMIVYLLNGIDLMASPDFNKKDLSNLRTVFWHAQQMARIGNWISTWKREINEKDISSGVFAYAITNKTITTQDLKQKTNDEVIRKIEESDTLEYFLKEWTKNYEKINYLKEKITTVDIDSYIKGLKNVLKFHISSEGFK